MLCWKGEVLEAIAERCNSRQFLINHKIRWQKINFTEENSNLVANGGNNLTFYGKFGTHFLKYCFLNFFSSCHTNRLFKEFAKH
jgi:hypothetical protein